MTSNADRHHRITDALRRADQLSVAELMELTGASDMTIRRDLEALAAQGILERYRGGARSLLLRGQEPPFALRAREGTEAKQRIVLEPEVFYTMTSNWLDLAVRFMLEWLAERPADCRVPNRSVRAHRPRNGA